MQSRKRDGGTGGEGEKNKVRTFREKRGLERDGRRDIRLVWKQRRTH